MPGRAFRLGWAGFLEADGTHAERDPRPPWPLFTCFVPSTGDVFILVFSLDSRESFDEVKHLQKQILEVKSCLKNKTKEAAELPMLICGNKNDHSELCCHGSGAAGVW